MAFSAIISWMSDHSGTSATREFYDEQGWHEEGGVSLDNHLFGVKEDWPIRIEQSSDTADVRLKNNQGLTTGTPKN